MGNQVPPLALCDPLESQVRFLLGRRALLPLKVWNLMGCPGGSVGSASDFGSGHDLEVSGFEPHVGLCADSSEPEACFGFCVYVSLSARPLLMLSLSLSKVNKHWGAWVAQSVGRPTSAQDMILQFVSSSPTSGSVLTARSLEPASDSVSASLSAPPPLTLCPSLSLFLSLSLKNKH